MVKALKTDKDRKEKMNREDTLNTTKRVLDLIEAKSLECAPSAKRLPSSMFVERERFEQDKACH